VGFIIGLMSITQMINLNLIYYNLLLYFMILYSYNVDNIYYFVLSNFLYIVSNRILNSLGKYEPS